MGHIVLLLGLVQLFDPNVAWADIRREEADLLWWFVVLRAVHVERENLVVLRALNDLAFRQVYQLPVLGKDTTSAIRLFTVIHLIEKRVHTINHLTRIFIFGNWLMVNPVKIGVVHKQTAKYFCFGEYSSLQVQLALVEAQIWEQRLPW